MNSPKSDKGFALPVISDKGPQVWRSLEEKNQDAALEAKRADEFPDNAGILSAFDRRGFLQLLGGTAALAGAAGCWRPPEENIYTHTRSPDYVPGIPQHYASAVTFDGLATGVVVRSYDGRPIKVEGNSLHPASRGATTAFEQAALYGLYDPDRARELTRRGVGQGWAGFLRDVGQTMASHEADGGARLRFLVQPTTSPTVAAMRRELRARFPNARFYSYAPASRDNVRKGAQAAFGQVLEPRYDLSRADIIVSLDWDFLYWEPERLRLSREFGDRRVPENRLNRLYAVEPTLSVTGMNADHRLRVKPSEVMAVARALASALGGELSGLGAAGGLSEKAQQFVAAVADDLRKARGRSVVMAGHRQPAAVHALCHAINQSLGNLGQTVAFARPVIDAETDGVEGLAALAKEIEAGGVDTLIIDAWNPVYASASDLDLGALLQKVPTTLYHHGHVDETARACNWLVPQAHELESWGDARSTDGTVSLIQPLVAPLFGGAPSVSFWAALVGRGEQSAYELVRAHWAERTGQTGEAFDAAWRKWLADGMLAGTAEQSVPAQVTMAGVTSAVQGAQAPAAGGLEVNIVPDYRVYDGRFGNNAWMQELPDPVTKVTWENTFTLSPSTAKALGVERHSFAQLTVNGKSVEGGVVVLPGHADDTVTVSLGFGRQARAERISGRYGFNAYALRTVAQPWIVPGGELKKLPQKYELALTQDHWSMEGVHGALRDIALMGTEADKDLEAAIHRNRNTITPDMVMQEPVDYSQGHKWGMTIDLARCIGCAACTIACQAENNIPVVGKDQVIRAREMHWLSIDRYFVGADENDPEVITQPRMCVHCETAPCEYVCPVNATVHSDEGLNDMVYNRCVGTRYCSNNCPYKVRRFNYLHYSYGKSTTEKMMMNPEVTVRARGVMEKCTYCTQRIQHARISARREHQQGLRDSADIREGEVKTACQTVCPTNAIVFGNLNDPNAPVTRLHEDKRRYDLLYALGTRPRTGYLARYKNYNPALPRPVKAEESH